MQNTSLTCPDCGSTQRQTKAGKTACDSQRYQCQNWKRFYTPQAKTWGYPPEKRMQAVKMYLDDGNYRRIARLLGIAPQTGVDGVAAYTNALQPQAEKPPLPRPVETAELQALCPFVGTKKNGVPLGRR